MGRQRRQDPITQAHLEKMQYRDKWRIVLSDGSGIFKAHTVYKFMITRRALEKLHCLISQELEKEAK